MSDIETLKKQLKIKTGITKRVLKENSLYRKELEEQTIKTDKAVAENADDPDNGDWAIRNGKRMLIESETVLTDSDARLGKAVEDLRALVVEARKISELSDDPDFIAAEEGLELAMI